MRGYTESFTTSSISMNVRMEQGLEEKKNTKIQELTDIWNLKLNWKKLS